MRSYLLFTFCFNILYYNVDAQSKGASTVNFSAEVGSTFSSDRQVPFWLRANQYGTVPFIAPIGSLRLGSTGSYYQDSARLGWGISYGVGLVGNAGAINQFLLPEAYIKISKGYFELVAGRRREVIGLVDSTLSSGSYSWSGNALPIPKVQFGTQGFAPLHFTRDLIAINAFFAHGWFSNTDSIKSSFLHQKAFFGRIGKPRWKVKLYGGVVHNVQWGGKSDYLGKGNSVNGQLPSSFYDFLHIVVAKQPNQSSGISYHDRVNQFGNHVGSIDFGAEITLSNWDILAYHQHAFEDKSGLAFINFPDGLNGLQIKRRTSNSSPTSSFQIKRLLIEYLTTMHQSGSTFEIDHRMYQGIDDYFNNFQYRDGWSHAGNTLGTPFISRRQEVLTKWQDMPGEHKLTYINNRVNVFNFGLVGQFNSGIYLSSQLSFSHNYGTYRNPFNKEISQFSAIVWLKYPTKWLGGAELNTAISLDQGELYKNRIGGWISLAKRWKN